MDKNASNQVCQQVYRRFPAFKGQRPKISAQGTDRFLLVFSDSGQTADGKTISQRLRVVATADGRIVKTSMKR